MQESVIKKALTEYNRFRAERSTFIYQMGKVGSTSIEEAVPHGIHLHTLYGNFQCPFAMRMWRPGLQGLLKRNIGDRIRRWAIKSRHETKIITLVRNPVRRNISMFMQDMPFWITAHLRAKRPDMRYAGPSFLKEVFDEIFDHFYFDRWFDQEIYRLTGIDVFAHSFDVTEGYMLIEKQGCRLLALRLEDLSRVVGVVEEFIDAPLSLGQENMAENKWYNCLYGDFKRLVIEDSVYTNRILETKTARFFGYSEI